MIGTSIPEYIFIRGCILFLHHIAPVSLLYCVLLLLCPVLPSALCVHRAPCPIEVWLMSEAAFFTVIFLPHKYHLQRPAIHPELPSREKRQELFERCHITLKDPEKYLSQWFLGAKRENIKRENLKEFIGWAFLNTEQVKKEDEEEVEGYVRAMEKLLRRDLPPGKGSAKSLRLTLDKVDFLHRSLLWYLVRHQPAYWCEALDTDFTFSQCVSVVDTKMYWSMLYNGFHFHRIPLSRFFTLFPFRPLTLLSTYRSPVKHLTYWYRPHSSKTRLPVLFIHGIGIGLYPYTNFLRDLNGAREAGQNNAEFGIIALEIMPVSSRITHSALEKDVMVREIEAIVKHHGWSKFILVSHSYGSIISTHLLKSLHTAPFVGPVVLIDPVSFLLHLPDVAYNFTARRPVRANEHQLSYFGSKDMGVAHSLARRFFWSDNIIWKEDLEVRGGEGGGARDVTVVLSGKDLIVDTEAVRRYLTASSSEEPVANAGAPWAMKEDEKVTFTKAVQDSTGAWKERPWTGSGLEVLWFEHLDHAQVFDWEKTRRPVVKAIGVYSAKG